MRIARNGYRSFHGRENRTVVSLIEPIIGEVACEKFFNLLGTPEAARTVSHFDAAAFQIEMANVAGFNG